MLCFAFRAVSPVMRSAGSDTRRMCRFALYRDEKAHNRGAHARAGATAASWPRAPTTLRRCSPRAEGLGRPPPAQKRPPSTEDAHEPAARSHPQPGDRSQQQTSTSAGAGAGADDRQGMTADEERRRGGHASCSTSGHQQQDGAAGAAPAWQGGA